jgi:N-acetylneuraminate synthase
MDGPELAQLIDMSAEIFEATGGNKGPAEEEQVTMNFAFSSVCAVRDIRIGEVFTEDNIFPMRPSGGDFGPGEWRELLGRKAGQSVRARTQLRHADVE